jgi:hypothetical protein
MSPQFAQPDHIRQLFCSKLSAMYHSEVPLYGTLVSLVDETNESIIANQPGYAPEAGTSVSVLRVNGDSRVDKKRSTPHRPTPGGKAWSDQTGQPERTLHPPSTLQTTKHVPRKLLRSLPLGRSGPCHSVQTGHSTFPGVEPVQDLHQLVTSRTDLFPRNKVVGGKSIEGEGDLSSRNPTAVGQGRVRRWTVRSRRSFPSHPRALDF